MPRNVYFSQAVKSEQDLYEDLIVESLKIYGQDAYYIPRTLISRDAILNEDPASKFDDAYLIETYIENVDGFEGAGDLYSKFGLQIQDEIQFVISRKVWERRVGIFDVRYVDQDPRPLEGDLIFLPMTNTFFEINFVEDDKPFYQLSNLPVYRLSCSTFEYSEEDVDTGVEVIDQAINNVSYQKAINISHLAGEANAYDVGDEIKQIHVAEVKDSDGNVTTPEVASTAEVANEINLSDTTQRLFLSNIGVTNSADLREFFVSDTVPIQTISGPSHDPRSPLYGYITFIYNEVTDTTGQSWANREDAQNVEFESIADGFIDFSESNPFGDPSETY